jgi:hypothetical protein
MVKHTHHAQVHKEKGSMEIVEQKDEHSAPSLNEEDLADILLMMMEERYLCFQNAVDIMQVITEEGDQCPADS